MHRISYVLQAGFQVMALATQAVFEFANLAAPGQERLRLRAAWPVDGDR